MKRTILPFCLLFAVPGLTLAQAPPTTPPPEDNAFNPDRPTSATTPVPRDQWGPRAGDKELSVSGTGSSDNSFDSTRLSVSGDLGWFLTDALALGLRQTISYTDFDNGSDWDGATRGYVNWHFPIATALPFIGASIGGVYGDAVNDSGFAGLETGAKFYVRDNTFIQARIEYQWFFDSGDIDDTFDDGAFVYNLGVGYNF